MIHRYWSGPTPATEPMIGARVRSLHNDVRDWSDATLPHDVVSWLDAHTDRVRGGDRLRHRANMVRLWLLHEHGGVWLDHDVIPYWDLEQLEQPFAASHNRNLCNCVLGFPAGHAVLAAALAAIDSAPRSTTAQSVEVSGEGLLARLAGSAVELHPLPFDPLGRWQDPPVVLFDHLYANRSAIGGRRGA